MEAFSSAAYCLSFVFHGLANLKCFTLALQGPCSLSLIDPNYHIFENQFSVIVFVMLLKRSTGSNMNRFIPSFKLSLFF